jgi:NAD+ synthase (glutamine-hydrolysing)
MRHGFVRLAACTPRVVIGDPATNAKSIIEIIKEAREANVLVFPELCVTAYTCGDLFQNEALYAASDAALAEIASATASSGTLVFVGAPVRAAGKLYNCAVAMANGKILAAIPKSNIPNYREFYELRWFTPAPDKMRTAKAGGTEVPFGVDILIRCAEMPLLCVGAEVCEDIWVPSPPSNRHCAAGATIIANLSASNQSVGKEDYRRMLVLSRSAATISAYIYADCGDGESSTDLVFSGHDIIGDNGRVAAERAPFSPASDRIIYATVDLSHYEGDRRAMNTYKCGSDDGYTIIEYSCPLRETKLPDIEQLPFVPSDERTKARRCASILDIQSHGLAQRISASRSRGAVVNVSGGLDSTLALLVTVRATDLLGMPRTATTALSMPCFGTTSRTKSNAQKLCERLGVALRTIPIAEAVNLHFRDIGHDPSKRDVVYENAQARERTQIGFDIANANGALLVGTGDLSELALGWATYSGDQMSSYGVNAGVPKTLVRHVVAYCADEAERGGDAELAAVLRDILATPVSPELLPPDITDTGESIAQRTEELVGPYELHDFFLWHTLRYSSAPEKILRLARSAFAGVYDDEVIEGWLRVFIRRFYTQQFKRSCMPDGPKVGSVNLSPRGDWRMPSDAAVLSDPGF